MSLRISVIGTSYLGATHAAGMAELGHEVIGVDVVPEVVQVLNQGRSHFYEDGLDPLLARHTESGRLRFTTDPAEVADWADIHFLCVGTPQGDGGAADLSQLHTAVDALAPLLTRAALVVGRSTVPVGTAQALQERLRAAAPAGDGIEIAWTPEFLQEGHAVDNTLRPDRLVFGVQSEQAKALLHRCYALAISEDTPVINCDLATAELIKTAANAFLATKISFINAMAQMCQASGGDVTLLADALGHDKRIGREFLNAGLGFGGGCFPKDIRALAARARELEVNVLSDFIGSVESINQQQRTQVAELAIEQLGGDVTGRRIGILGAAFKPGTDDIRDSPALTVARQLAGAGAEVWVYDPQAVVPDNAIRRAATVREAVTDAELVLHLTEWPEFRQLDPAEVIGWVKQPLLIDGRLKLDRPRWTDAGWKIVQLGRAATV